jgi:oxygen-independent coproporphyrinogen-3 oxidase
LPFQEIEDVIDTIEKTKSLQPDRLAFIVTLTFLGLKAMDSAVLTTKTFQKDDKKRALYETGKKLLSENGYHEIGMDHLRWTDSLYDAKMAHCTVISWDTVRLKHK